MRSRVPALAILLVTFLLVVLVTSLVVDSSSGGPNSGLVETTVVTSATPTSIIPVAGEASTSTTQKSSEISTTSLTVPALPASLPAGARSIKAPILAYQDVGEKVSTTTGKTDLTVRTADFEAEMAHLSNNGYHPVGLRDIYLYMAGRSDPPKKPVVITFDDGKAANFTVVYPILKRFGFTATFFVVVQKVGEPGYMTWDNLREMSKNGMWIESHTYSHQDLARLSVAELRAELTKPRTVIKREIGVSSAVLAYPSGSYDSAVIAEARTAGYKMAVTTKPGTELNPTAAFELPRVQIPAFLSLDDFETRLK